MCVKIFLRFTATRNSANNPCVWGFVDPEFRALLDASRVRRDIVTSMGSLSFTDCSQVDVLVTHPSTLWRIPSRARWELGTYPYKSEDGNRFGKSTSESWAMPAQAALAYAASLTSRSICWAYLSSRHVKKSCGTLHKSKEHS